MVNSPRGTAAARLILGPVLILASWLALTPNPVEMPPGAQLDKVAHFATYVVLAFLVDASLPERKFDLKKWAFLFGYGLAIELIQSQVPNRMFSLADLAANTAGIAVYAFMLIRLLRAGEPR